MTTAAAETIPLKREMTSFGGLLITLSCLSPSIGVFIVGSQVIHQVGSGAILCFVAPLVLSVSIAAVYAELGSAFPHCGAEYSIAGRVLGPTAGFAMLATTLLSYTLTLSISGLGIADYVRVLAPGIQPVPTALAAVAAATLIGIFSVRLNAWVTGIFLAVEILALAVTAGLGFAHAHDVRHVAAMLAHPLVAGNAGGLHAVPPVAMIVGVSAGIYAYNGYGSVVALGEEIRDARRGIGAIVYWAIGVAAVVELVPMLGILAGAPDLAALSRSEAPIPDFLRAVGGPRVSVLISLAVAGAIFNAMIATMIIGARQVYGTARDRCWPVAVSRQLDRVHGRFGSPWIATCVVGGIGLACCFIPLALQVIVIANGVVAIYATLCVAVLVGRRNGTTAHSHAKMRLFPLLPILALVGLVGVVWADLLDPETGRAGLIAAAAVCASGAAYFWLAPRRNGNFALRGPIDE